MTTPPNNEFKLTIPMRDRVRELLDDYASRVREIGGYGNAYYKLQEFTINELEEIMYEEGCSYDYRPD